MQGGDAFKVQTVRVRVKTVNQIAVIAAVVAVVVAVAAVVAVQVVQTQTVIAVHRIKEDQPRR